LRGPRRAKLARTPQGEDEVGFAFDEGVNCCDKLLL
jgi:hypothetical protein